MSETFQEWAILELMGHRKLAGLVSEATIAGGAFIRIDVPGAKGNAATQFYSPASVYCITPVSEELARQTAQSYQPAPVSRYELPAEIPHGRPEDEGLDFGREEDPESERHTVTREMALDAGDPGLEGSPL